MYHMPNARAPSREITIHLLLDGAGATTGVAGFTGELAGTVLNGSMLDVALAPVGEGLKGAIWKRDQSVAMSASQPCVDAEDVSRATFDEQVAGAVTLQHRHDLDGI